VVKHLQTPTLTLTLTLSASHLWRGEGLVDPYLNPYSNPNPKR